MLDIRSSWDKIASLYQQRYHIETGTVHYGPLCAGENKLKLLGDIKGYRTIDLGCGAGQNSVALAKMGALVTAIDFSGNQLYEAGKLADREKVSIKFIESDMVKLPMLRDKSFELAVSACAMAFVRDIKSAFAETCRILKPGGIFVVSVMHPVQYILDGTEKAVLFNSKFPFNPRLLKWSWDFKKKTVRFQHYLRSLAEYHNSLSDTGFSVKKIIEPKPTLKTPHIGFSREIMKEYPYIARHLPITLIFKALKPRRDSGEIAYG
jgi:ubiquinone/menaquinone biosynthesis C-methylase UbiE